MPIQFPPSPSVNQEYTYEGKVWAWDGSSWVGVRQETGIQKSNIWAKQNLLIPKRGFGLNSGYNGTTDQRRTKAGTIPMLKQYMERDLGLFDNAPWTPSRITTDLWFDASDGTTITLNGSTVSQWNDKSGNARNISQATTANQPTYSGVNSTITFDGSNDILSNASVGAADLVSVTLITVMKMNSGGATEDVLMGIGQTGNVGRIRTFYRGPNQTTVGFAGWAADVGTSTHSWDIGGGYHIFSGWNTALGASSNVRLSRDGVTPTVHSTSGSLVASINGFSVGSLQGGSVANYYSAISVKEIIVLYSAVTDTNRQLIEGYLAWKWGLQANLPSDHPYKSSAP
jgi:hypothetical protein